MSQKAKDILLKITVNVCRLILASTFIFSGFVNLKNYFLPSKKLYKMKISILWLIQKKRLHQIKYYYLYHKKQKELFLNPHP